MNFSIRSTKITDYAKIKELCLSVYPNSIPWSEEQIQSHIKLFPEGQWVVEETATQNIVGMSASLIIKWDEYEFTDNWKDFTDAGLFTNHDPFVGRTLYGAEIMVNPQYQGQGIGKILYAKREEVVKKLGLLRIRAGARLRGYCTYANEMSPEEYTIQVIAKKIYDPTLSFQLKRGFRVLAVVSGYLKADPESLGHAAVIEWCNPEIAKPEDYLLGEARYRSNYLK
jgi:GNAT superfamily N-acetyltransferase